MASLGIERLGSGGAGTPGADGAPGRDGVPGFPGEDGEYGMMFVPPVRGGAGTPGAPGATGADGQFGPPGPPGADGDDFGMWVPPHRQRHDHSSSHDTNNIRPASVTITAVGSAQLIFTDSSYGAGGTGPGIIWPGLEHIGVSSVGVVELYDSARVNYDLNVANEIFQNSVFKVLDRRYRPPVYWPDDGDDGFFMPGPRGVAGSIGTAGARGRQGPPGLPGDDGDTGMFIPGKRGATGPAGGGGGTATTVETNTGSTPVFQGKFTITDAAIGASSKVLAWQAPGGYTGKGTTAGSADEATMDPIHVMAVIPAAGSAVVYWETVPIYSPILGYMDAQETVPSVASATGSKRQDEAAMVLAAPSMGRSSTAGYQQRGIRRLGKVKGNIKFSYLVFA